jgi:hypothetical protein
MLLQYMQCAVREKRVLAVLCCDVMLLLLLLMGLVGCLLFWLGVFWSAFVLSRRTGHGHTPAGTYSLIDWEIPPDTGAHACSWYHVSSLCVC